MTERTFLNRRWVCVISTFIICTICMGPTTAAWAQNQPGSISGTLMDPAGAVLKGAQLSIPAKDMTASTDEQGRFFFYGLEPGDYTLSVSYIGFAELKNSRVRSSRTEFCHS
jgi:hypothetical protein